VYSTGLLATAMGALPEGAASAALNLTLPPIGRLNGRLVDASGQPVAAANLTIYSEGGSEQPFAASTDADGRFTLFPLPFGRFEVSAISAEGLRAALAGELTMPEVETLLVLPQPGTIEVIPEQPVPFSSAQLLLADDPLASLPGAFLVDGRYRFENVPPGLFSVQLSPGDDSVSGRLEPGGTVQLTSPAAAAQGVVYGRAVAADGLFPLANRLVSVNTYAPIGMARAIGNTRLAGSYLVRNVRPGTLATVISSNFTGRVDIGTGGNLAAGGRLQLDLVGGTQPVTNLPTEQNGVRVGQGLVLNEPPYQNDMVLRVNGIPYANSDLTRLAENGTTLEIGPLSLAGALVERRLYIPQGKSWMRYLEIVSNPGDSPLEVRLQISGVSAGAAVLTSSGLLPASTADRWVAAVGNPERPVLGFVFSGSGGQDAAEVRLTSREQNFTPSQSYRYGWDVALEPGETAAFLHFLVSGSNLTVEAAAQLAAALADGTETGAREGIDPGTLSALRNFV
jgi:hypothetical protein